MQIGHPAVLTAILRLCLLTLTVITKNGRIELARDNRVPSVVDRTEGFPSVFLSRDLDTSTSVEAEDRRFRYVGHAWPPRSTFP